MKLSIKFKTKEVLNNTNLVDIDKNTKVGDTVECIKREGFTYEGDEYIDKDNIQIGKQYTISDIYHNNSCKRIELNFKNCKYIHPSTSFKKVK